MSSKNSPKWNERLLSRNRINEYATMLLGPRGTANNDAYSQVVSILYRLLNEQDQWSVQQGRNRARNKLGIPVDGPVGDEVIVKYGKSVKTETWPEWKKKLHKVLFSEKPKTETTERVIDDGFGNRWIKCGRGCKLQIVRPGKVQCEMCEDAEQSQRIPAEFVSPAACNPRVKE